MNYWFGAGQIIDLKKHQVQLVWLVWWYRFSYVIVKKPGWRGQVQHLLLTDSERIPPPTPPSVDEESSGYDRRFDRKLTPVCSTPEFSF